MNGPDKTAPFYCHAPAQPDSCATDADCQTPYYPTSWCMNDDTKSAPFVCKIELPPTCAADADCQLGNLVAAAFFSSGCATDADCPSSYCVNDDTKTAPFSCHTCGDDCCLTDGDCAGEGYCQNDSTKMPPYFCHAAAAEAEAAIADEYTWDKSCGTQYDRLLTSTLTMSTDSGIAAGAVASLHTEGTTMLHAPVETGAWVIRVYEDGQAKPVAEFDGDLMSALVFDDDRSTTFHMDTSFTMPAVSASGDFTVSYTATDATKAAFFCIEVQYSVAAADAALVAIDDGAYCMNDSSKTAPFYCHAPPQPSCATDADCQTPWFPTSWCMNDDTKTAPFQCKVELPPTCTVDADCDLGRVTTYLRA